MSSKNFKCKYCDKILASQGSLSNHINKSKQCISQRKKNKNETKKIFSCKYCTKTYTTKHNLEKHISKNHQVIIIKNEHEEKFRKMEQKYEKQIRELQDKLENIAIKASTKPSTVNNRNTYIQNNLTPLKDEDFTKNLDKITRMTLVNGYQKLGEYALEYPLKDNNF